MVIGLFVPVAGGRVAIRGGAQVRVELDETSGPLRADGRMTVVAIAVITAGPSGGRVVVRLDEVARRPAGSWTVVVTGRRRSVVVVGERTLRLVPGDRRVLRVVEHPAGISPESVLAAVAAEGPGDEPQAGDRSPMAEPGGVGWADASWPATAGLEAPTRDMDVPEMDVPEMDVPEMGVPEAAPLQLAEVGASMPSRMAVGDDVAVRVRLTRGEIRVRDATAHDEQVIVVRPDRLLTVSVLRRGFALAPARSDSPRETGRRQVRLPAPGEPDAILTFRLRAAQAGPGEVQVVVRQRQAQPLATLRLTAVVQPPGAGRATPPPATGAEDPGEYTAPLEGAQPFLAPHSLTIDENIVGRTSRLTFVLVRPGFRRSFTRVVADKVALLTDLFRRLDDAWRELRDIDDPPVRADAFGAALRSIGADLAAAVLPAELLVRLRECLHDVDELTVITSGETDIPWELVHVGEGGPGSDPDARGFLGRAGLVRWVYNTRHPTELRVRPGAAYYLIPRYDDPTLVLPLTGREREYLEPFRPRAVRPGSRSSLSRLLGSGRVDLLHFAGHGRSDDEVDPPVREMLLSSYRYQGDDVAGRRAGTFTLDDLRDALPEREPLAFPAPGPIVVVNACRLGRPTSTRSEVGGFAETFLRGGAGAFVGCLWSVGDAPARAFVETFYALLTAGTTVASATVRAREAARRSGDLSWLAYTVYAHPDARLVEPSAPSPARRPIPEEHPMPAPRTSRSTSTGDREGRSVALGRAELVAMHPYVLDVPDGRLAEGPSRPPDDVDDYRSTAADVDALFGTVLPEFLAGRPGPVPLVIWAHGGLVDKAAGLGIAHRQVDWWKANGCFPVHFVWETGFASSLWDAVKDGLPFGGRGLDDVYDMLVEKAVRAIPASIPTWRAMKTTAALAAEPETGGAWYFARKLGEFVAANPDAVTVHGVGHSAGSIFHAHLLPAILDAGVPRIESLTLLAPAIRVDEFTRRLMTPGVLDRIGRLTMFTMSEADEKKDTCVGVYGKSLLYMIRAALEEEPQAEILGLQECVLRNADLTRLFGAPGSGSQGEVAWARTVGGGAFSSSTSTSHGGFDDDQPTMDSVARRILGVEALPLGWPGARGAGRGLRPSRDEASAYLAARQGTDGPVRGRRRALCIGIDRYPSPHALKGCVADAVAWKEAFETLGFETELVKDKEATRQHMVERIKDLVVSSRAGDVLALQYAGHGTTVPDLDGDEAIEDRGDDELRDEAICPVDFGDGNLVVDDDLGEIWNLLPDGVSLTMFFDSCHSGGNQRDLMAVPASSSNARARLVSLSRTATAAYRAKRGRVRAVTTSRDRDRGVFFAACRPDEVAWESDGHGDFSRLAVPLLISAGAGTSNQDFYRAVMKAFGAHPRQQPVLLDNGSGSRGLLAPDGQDRTEPVDGTVLVPAPVPLVPTTAVPPETVSGRDRAIATILRGMADLVEAEPR